MKDYQARIARLQSLLKAEGASVALLAGTDQMRYLTGWQEGGHERFVGLFVPAEGDSAFLVPKMNAPQAEKTPSGITRVLGWEDAGGWKTEAESLLTPLCGSGAGTIFVDDELHSVHLLGLQSLFPQAKFYAIGAMMARLRQIKTPGELDALERAAQRIDTIFEASLAELKEGMTETDFQNVIYAALKRQDTTPSFTPLICFGANTALPHHHSGDTRLKPGDPVIIDIGCRVEGYASDITRTVSFGEPTDASVAEIYSVVFRAHHAARDLAKPGLSGAAVDAAARQVITDAGYGPQFVHRTGHGIGLSCHEPPDMVANNPEPLQPGMCFSVEPGIYLQDRFGVRIENIVTVTPDGVRSLNAEPASQLRIVHP